MQMVSLSFFARPHFFAEKCMWLPTPSQGLGMDAARSLMYSDAGKDQGKGAKRPLNRSPGGGAGIGGSGGREDPCLPRGYEWSHLHRGAQHQGGLAAAGHRAEASASAVVAGISGLGDTPSIATGDFEARCRPYFYGPFLPPHPSRLPR